MSGRLIDIPYHNSPPLLFTYRQTAPVAAGSYTFSPPIVKSPFTPSRPILPHALYSVRDITFAMDIPEAEYYGAIAVLPSFSMYLQSEAAAPGLREAVVLSKFLDNMPYRLHILGTQLLEASNSAAQGFNFNRLLGTVTGTLTQTGPLLGKLSVTAIVILSVQEIVSRKFISEFRSRGDDK